MNRRVQPLPAVMTHATSTGLRSRINEAWILAHRWKGRIFFAFADQGLYSATNFLLTILYASWLPLDAFGRYVVVWTISLFIEAIQISLVVDSLPAIVSRYGRRNRQRIDNAALWMVAAFSLATSVLIAGAAAALSASLPNYAGPLFVLALVNPLQRLYLFCRRLCYIRDRQSVAAAAALAYGLALFAGAFTLAEFDESKCAGEQCQTVGERGGRCHRLPVPYVTKPPAEQIEPLQRIDEREDK